MNAIATGSRNDVTVVLLGHEQVDHRARAQHFYQQADVPCLALESLQASSSALCNQRLIEALQQASGALDQQAERAEAAQLVAQLTDREREVLDMVGRGWSTREIAETLNLSPRTVDTHRANIAQKLGTTSVAEFARLALIGQAP